ncbi:glycosyl transferase family 1 [Polaribacter aquimarinus]|uniref:Glycosyl transferase family 1 n=2 Tax=Polaribacter aquimarinus TaxID=2100726 RepID=A0A2U2J7H9_9FLAO|nr:glycosyl transferase family 1 [Polaribacter aquimarinus]
MNKKILYIGNNLNMKTKYPTALLSLVTNLKNEGFDVIVSSNMQNKILRLSDMIFSTITKRKIVDYVLIDTYSTTNFYYALIISQLARFFNLKYIPILHGGNLPNRLENNKFLSNLIFKYSYINVAPSNYLKFIFEKHRFKTLNIPNTISIEKYPFKKREFYKPRLLWVRSFKSIYNPILALKVLILLKKEYPKATLCMVGPFLDTSYKESINYLKNNNLENSVEFTNVITKEEWHKKSESYDIFINTTNIDNTPVSVIEAMALGLPVVSTNVGGIPFLIKHKIDGMLVEKNNVIEMKNAITSILNNEYPNIAISARKKVEEYDWSVVRNKWLSILNS